MNIRQQASLKAVPALSWGSTPIVHLQRKCACGQHTISDGECEGCRQKREQTMQRAAVSATPSNSVPPIVHDVLSSSGQPLDASTRAFMEPRFGYDFSHVRVHTDARAAESARAVNALAYTVGRDVVFGMGQYAPGTSEGKRLLAHELTHVVQQRFGKADVNHNTSSNFDYEKEANEIANTFVTNTLKSVNPGVTTDVILARQTAGDEIPPIERSYELPPFLIPLEGRAVREPSRLRNGVVFNGTLLIVFRGGKIVKSVSAVSGDADSSGTRYTEDVIDHGPIPKGTYAISPHVTQPSVTTLQEGVCGAKAISSGFQELTSRDQSPCEVPTHYCTIDCSSIFGPGKRCFTPVDCWGSRRIKIEGSARVKVPGGGTVIRGGFYIHGGDHSVNVTGGCIKVFDDSVFDELRKFKDKAPLVVE